MTRYEIYDKCMYCGAEKHKGSMESDDELFMILVKKSPDQDRLYSHSICDVCEENRLSSDYHPKTYNDKPDDCGYDDELEQELHNSDQCICKQ